MRVSWALLALAVGCAGQQNVDPTAARAAVYGSEFDAIFQEVALEVRKHYPNLAAKPQERAVKTAWHQLPLTETVSTAEDPQSVSHEERQGNPNSTFDQRRAYRKDNTKTEVRHFVRFDVVIEPVGAPGSQRWRVVVTGQASEYDNRGVPTEMRGAERPYWLDGRIAKLEVAIHKRIKGMSVVAQ